MHKLNARKECGACRAVRSVAEELIRTETKTVRQYNVCVCVCVTYSFIHSLVLSMTKEHYCSNGNNMFS